MAWCIMTNSVRYVNMSGHLNAMRTAKRPVLDPSDGVPRHSWVRQTRRRINRPTHKVRDPRNLLPVIVTTFRLACEWCLPWTVFSYPGHERGLLAILGRILARRSVQMWKQKNNPPVWAATAIRDYIRHRCEVGLGLVDQLNAYIDERERAVELKHQRGRLRNHRPADE